MSKTDISKDAVELPRSIHLGAMNDALFVIDGKPCPGPYDGPIPKNDGPNALTKAFPKGCDEQLQTICDLYNRQADTLRALLAARDRDAAVIEAAEKSVKMVWDRLANQQPTTRTEATIYQWLRAALSAQEGK